MKNLPTLSKNLTTSFLEQFELDQKPEVNFATDAQNSQKDLAKTAFYDPQGMKITVYISDRHVKDILRSLSHELVHHMQNCRGDLSGDNTRTEEGYAQSNPHMREMEREAYEVGNMFFRDWEDNLKKNEQQLYETIYKSNKIIGDARMSIENWKNHELNGLLMEKWGFTPKEENLKEDIGPVINLIDGYKGLEKQLPDDDTLEDEEAEITKADPHPLGVEARTKGLEEDDEKSLKETLEALVRELLKAR
jgi:hypothetical protein